MYDFNHLIDFDFFPGQPFTPHLAEVYYSVENDTTKVFSVCFLPQTLASMKGDMSKLMQQIEASAQEHYNDLNKPEEKREIDEAYESRKAAIVW